MVSSILISSKIKSGLLIWARLEIQRPVGQIQHMIILSGTLTVNAGGAEPLKSLAAALLPLSRAEAGCIRYDFLQDPFDARRFFFFELWKSRSDLEQHFAKPYFKAFAEKLPTLIEGEAEIVTYEAPGAVPAF